MQSSPMIAPHSILASAPVPFPFPLSSPLSVYSVPSVLKFPTSHPKPPLQPHTYAKSEHLSPATPIFSIPPFHSFLTLFTLFFITPAFAMFCKNTRGVAPSPTKLLNLHLKSTQRRDLCGLGRFQVTPRSSAFPFNFQLSTVNLPSVPSPRFDCRLSPPVALYFSYPPNGSDS